MLRILFDEPLREERGRLKEIFDLAEELTSRYASSDTRVSGDRATLLAWMRSIATAFDELEQSVYCAAKYAERVKRAYVEEMDEEEAAEYRRHLYFYKNGFIRLFSVLDKLGSFLNDRYQLHTERIKERYSYFTVLRRMRELRQHPQLWQRLDEIKSAYRDPLHELRLMRNHEVHAINTELLDERGRIRLRSRDGKEQVEDLRHNVATLQSGFDMVGDSLHAVLMYCRKHGC